MPPVSVFHYGAECVCVCVGLCVCGCVWVCVCMSLGYKWELRDCNFTIRKQGEGKRESERERVKKRETCINTNDSVSFVHRFVHSRPSLAQLGRLLQLNCCI